MDEEAPPLESELQPLWQMAHNDCTDKFLTGGAFSNDNQQKEILAPVDNATSSTDNNPPEQGGESSVLHYCYCVVSSISCLTHSALNIITEI